MLLQFDDKKLVKKYKILNTQYNNNLKF